MSKLIEMIIEKANEHTVFVDPIAGLVDAQVFVHDQFKVYLPAEEIVNATNYVLQYGWKPELIDGWWLSDIEYENKSRTICSSVTVCNIGHNPSVIVNKRYE